MVLALDERVRLGVTARLSTRDGIRRIVGLLEELGFQSLWAGDHIAFTSPILDPMLGLSQAAALSDKLTVGTAVYLLPLRSAAAAAKLASSLDHLADGRFIFGIGAGGEFPREFAACGVPLVERGQRMTEGIEVMRKLWGGQPVSHAGRIWRFEGVHMQPAPLTPGGPRIWCGGRSEAALRRAGAQGDGWISYVVTPDQFAAGLATIETARAGAGRGAETFGTAHLLFCRLDDSYDRALDDASALLSKRYAMDFRKAAQRYCALGNPEAIAGTLRKFHTAGVRHFILDMLGTPEEREAQLRRFAKEVRPQIREIER
jgi:alkanesulfonate monooxygenase SsuD/methylene tetrahydromethanopterin reductase-like flavin-dependent oxidoreductase (luciferase family)